MRKAYRMSRLSNVSGALSNCEVCNTQASALYLLTPQRVEINSVTLKEYLTSHGEIQTAGHRKCLAKLTD
ncbi:hypothetical protein G6Z92_18595 [Vibrio aestuarianus subsp. cardii]|uniref:hypothetical protein n=1 Tax=Vibrio aestuarianus TaxID=28171 RepID=UPI0015C57EE8|nr:hypothetical protein [Vibrio aestuarianus]NGZ68926.1 hypothetical protein [Vibrio aestuarianus subsp. cardii]